MKHLLFKKILTRLLQFFLLFLLTYGFFYFSYKYYFIDFGGSDFKAYYKMYLNPLDYNATIAPFVYRQFHAVMTYLIYESNLFYAAENAFQFHHSTDFEVRIFFAALLSNYIALLATGVVVMAIIEERCPSANFLVRLFGGLLCFCAFLVQQSVITGLSEGWTWFLVALIFYFYHKKWFWLSALTILFAIVQRELIPIIFGVIAFFDLIFYRKFTMNFYLKTFMISCFAFVFYLLLRKFLLPTAGYETQMTISGIVDSLTTFQLTKSLIFQGLLSQNLFFIYFILAITSITKKIKNWQKTYIVQLTAVLGMLFLLGIMAGIGNNIGRIGSMITPIIVVFCIDLGLNLDLKYMRI